MQGPLLECPAHQRSSTQARQKRYVLLICAYSETETVESQNLVANDSEAAAGPELAGGVRGPVGLEVVKTALWGNSRDCKGCGV